MREEQVTLVDEHNAVTGSAPRSVMRRDGLPHRATYVLVFNEAGDVFVQRRTGTKDIFPGYLDICAGGVVQAGESYDESAERELQEELGIAGIPLTPLFEFFYAEQRNRVHGRAYRCVYEGPMKLQEEEVESGEFIAPAQIIERAATQCVTPDSLYVLTRFLKHTGTQAPFTSRNRKPDSGRGDS